jgi:membrane-associated protease RseP (regulator of RpoE activity)
VLTLGKSLLFSLFNDGMGQGLIPMSEIYHFPFIFAGWVGLLVTAINLIPIGQLDGGHTVYALFGSKATTMSRLAFGGLIGMSIFLYIDRGAAGTMWVPWMIILALIGLRHPPTYNDRLELTTGRRQLGWVCIFIFIICFMPLPLHF